MTQRIGFACKWIDNINQINGIGSKDPARLLSTGTTTVSWLNRQSKQQAEQKLTALMNHNIQSLHNLIARVGQLSPNLRMVRLSSEVLPVYTHKDYQYFWRSDNIQSHLQQQFKQIGDLARSLDVRLSFHPGQFTVLASHRPDVVDNSIAEFEYHADMARMMGYGVKFQDFKINVHISGKLGPAGILAVLPRLSDVARNCITIENEENTYGVNHCLELADHVPIVLDVHHHWVHEGSYIDRDDARISRILDSWRGVRPVLHYSQSRENVLSSHNPDVMPNFAVLLTEGLNKPKLRAHSDFYWNQAVNKYVLQFFDAFDIMCESKAKNLASQQLYEQYINS